MVSTFDAGLILRGQAGRLQEQNSLFNRLFQTAQANRQDRQQQLARQDAQAARAQAQQNWEATHDLARRKFDWQMNQPPSIEEQAMKGIYAQKLEEFGGDATKAAIATQSLMQGPKTSYQADTYGDVRAVTQPTLFDQLYGTARPAQATPSPATPMTDGIFGSVQTAPPQAIKPSSGNYIAGGGLDTTMNILDAPTDRVMNTAYQQKGTFDAQTDVAADAAKLENKLNYEKRLRKFQAEMELSSEEKAKIPGRQEFDKVLGEVLTNLEELKDKGAATSSQNSALKNIGAYFRNTESLDPFGLTPGGQDVERALGTEEQAIRDKISGREPRLFNAIKKASGLTGTELNSQFEVQNQLKQLGNAEMSYDARVDLLRSLSAQFGTGKWTNFGQNQDAPQGVDPSLLEFMTPEERALFYEQ